MGGVVKYISVLNIQGDDYYIKDSLAREEKLTKTNEANKIYGTNSSGDQVVYDLLNIENGNGKYSIVQREGDTSTGEIKDRKNYCYGRSNIAFGHKNKTYQRDSFVLGGGNNVGLTEAEFNQLYPSGLDPRNKNYEESYSFSLSVGADNIIKGYGSMTLGVFNNISSVTSSVEGSVAIGANNIITGSFCFASGAQNSISGNYSSGLGQAVTSSNQASFAAGYSTISKGVASFSEGDTTTASGRGSHCEGARNTAKGDGSHAEGYMSNTSAVDQDGNYIYGIASGVGSHAENINNIAEGTGSHVGGVYSKATGPYHFVHGAYLISSDIQRTQALFGYYNLVESTSLLIIGNGKNNSSRSNAFEVTEKGYIKLPNFDSIDASTSNGYKTFKCVDGILTAID